MSGKVTSGRRPLPTSIYLGRLQQLEGKTFTQYPKRERDRLRQQRYRARLAVQGRKL